LKAEPDLKKEKSKTFLYEPFAISSLTTGVDWFFQDVKEQFLW